VVIKHDETLEKDAVIQAVTDATATGTQEAFLVGKDLEGNRLKGSREVARFV
jgi:hypothetical protein